jgi:transposase-like protein
MNRSASLYKRHRFPPDIIRNAVWLYFRFALSHRDIEVELCRKLGDGVKKAVALHLIVRHLN